jgi:drug/metabolite transporter (DMT)-like permease
VIDPRSWLRHPRVLAGLGAFTIAFSSILVKLSHASPSTAAIFRCAYALPVLGMIVWREDRRFGARSWAERWPAALSGVFLAVDLVMWHHSIEDLGAGLATVLANIQVVLVPLVAWAVLSERPSRHLLSALPVAAAGVVLISGVADHGAYGRHPGTGALFGLGAGVTYAAFLLLLRHGGSDRRRGAVAPAGPLFDATVAATITAVVVGVVVGDARLVPAWPSAGWLALLALTSQVIGWLLITVSLPRLPAAVTSLLLMIQPAGSLIFGAIIFGESPDAVQLLGVALVLSAVVFATRGGAAVASELRKGLADEVQEGVDQQRPDLSAVEALALEPLPGGRFGEPPEGPDRPAERR